MRHNSHPDCEEHQEIGCILDGESRKIYVFGGITDEVAAEFLVAIQALDRDEDKPITVIINSPGGLTEAGYVMYDAIKLTKNQVRLEGFGKVYSMAVMVFLAGDERYMSPQCELMVHDVYVETMGELSVQSAATLSNDLLDSNNKYQKLVAHYTGTPLKKIAEMCKEETYLDAKSAVKFGFADGILKSRKKHVVKSKRVEQGSSEVVGEEVLAMARRCLRNLRRVRNGKVRTTR